MTSFMLICFLASEKLSVTEKLSNNKSFNGPFLVREMMWAPTRYCDVIMKGSKLIKLFLITNFDISMETRTKAFKSLTLKCL